MAVVFWILLGLAAFYVWLRGHWFPAVVLCLAWSYFAHDATVPQFAAIVAISFLPFTARLAWRHRAAIADFYRRGGVPARVR